MKKLHPSLLTIVLLMSSAMILASCGTTVPGSVQVVRRVVGTDIIGVKGLTPVDQRKINKTIVGLCGAEVYTPDECETHGELIK